MRCVGMMGILGSYGILWDPGICKARQVREARSGQRAAEGSDLGSVGLVILKPMDPNLGKLKRSEQKQAAVGFAKEWMNC